MKQNKFLFGVPEITPCIRIPGDVIKWKAKFRNDSFAFVFLKYADRIERWILAYDETFTYLEPTLKQGENKIK